MRNQAVTPRCELRGQGNVSGQRFLRQQEMLVCRKARKQSTVPDLLRL
jgi:hypothetical protein